VLRNLRTFARGESRAIHKRCHPLGFWFHLRRRRGDWEKGPSNTTRHMLGDCTILCVVFLCGSVTNVIVLPHPPPSSSSHEPTSSSSTPPSQPTTCRAAPPHCQCHRHPHLTSSIPTGDEPLNPQTLTSERRHHRRCPCLLDYDVPTSSLKRLS
jgi:hypothetical protein